MHVTILIIAHYYIFVNILTLYCLSVTRNCKVGLDLSPVVNNNDDINIPNTHDGALVADSPLYIE